MIYIRRLIHRCNISSIFLSTVLDEIRRSASGVTCGKVFLCLAITEAISIAPTSTMTARANSTSHWLWRSPSGNERAEYQRCARLIAAMALTQWCVRGSCHSHKLIGLRHPPPF